MNDLLSPTSGIDSRLAEFRALFPFLRSGLIFMNHASVAPQSSLVVDAVHRYLKERSEGSVETYLRDIAVVSDCRKRLARLLHADSEDDIAFTMNTSDALNIVAAGIRWKQGDRVLLNDLEFPANLYPFLNQRSRGVGCDVVTSTDGMMPVDRLMSHVTPRTRMVAVSAVQFLSGYRIDLRALGEECRKRGIIFVVDGIQAAGVIPIDVRACHIDVFAAGGQKWLMGPQGIGMLYVAPHLREQLDQSSLGWLGVEHPWEFSRRDQPPARTARRFEGGTLNIPGVYALNASVGMLEAFGIQAIEQRVLDLTDALTGALSEIRSLRRYSPALRNDRAGIVTVAIPESMDAEVLHRHLLAQKLVISLRSGMLRFAPHLYNTHDEVSQAVELTRNAVMSQ